MSRIHSKLNIRIEHRPKTEQNVCFSLVLAGATKKPYHTIQETLGWHETPAEMGVSDKYRRCSPTKTTKCRSRDRGLDETDVFFRRKNRKPTRSVWPQCSQTNRRVYRILSNYEVTVGFSRSASRAVTSELELETKYTAREMSRAHLGWMISRSRGNIVLWLSLSPRCPRGVFGN